MLSVVSLLYKQISNSVFALSCLTKFLEVNINMKAIARITAFVMATLSLLLLAVGCVDNSGIVDDTTTAAVIEGDDSNDLYDANGYLKSTLPELDYKGEVITVLAWEDVEKPEFEIELPTGELINDAIYTRNLHVEEKLKVKLAWDMTKGQYNDGLGAKYAQTVKASYDSGDSTWDLLTAHSRTIALTASYGYCADLNTLEYLDFDMPWWPTVMTETATIGDSMFFVTGDVSINSIHQMYCIFFNKRIMNDHKLASPAQMVLDNEWTIENMQSLTKDLYQDLDTSNSKNAADAYGFTTLYWHLDAIYFGVGLKQVEKDPDNLLKISDDFFSEKAISVSDSIGDWLATQDNYVNDDNYAEPFLNDHAFMVLTRHKDVADDLVSNEVDFEFGIVPAPKYNADQERHITAVGNPVSFYAIYAKSKDLDRSAAVLECWASEAYRTTTPALFETTLKLKYSATSVESQMYDIIRSGIVFDFGRLFNPTLANMSDLWTKSCVENTNWKTASTVYKISLPKLLKNKVTAKFEEFMN